MSPSRNRTYTAWYKMRATHYREVCPEWNDYETFRREMGEKPAGRNVMLCRRELTRDYSKANCYWGKRNHCGQRTVLVRVNGAAACLTDWSRQIGVPQQHLSKILKRRGLSGLQTYVAARISKGGEA